tara:strand:+ start:349 stop:609 length:261 start_codon:yes stop_codon:yes gene_type:complete
MFILTEQSSGGVFAVQDKRNIDKKIVQCFEEEDDAVRYLNLLEGDDYPDTLIVSQVEQDVIALNCVHHGYEYTVITPNDFVIPDIL